MNPFLKAFSVAVMFAAICFIAMFVRAAFIEHVTFEPNWPIIGAAAALSFVLDLAHSWVTR